MPHGTVTEPDAADGIIESNSVTILEMEGLKLKLSYARKRLK